MATTLEQAVHDVLDHHGLGQLWWGGMILQEWPHVVGRRFASKAHPILEKSPLEENGRLTIAVPNSSWAQELSLLGIPDRLNAVLGERLIRDVRFEIRSN